MAQKARRGMSIRRAFTKKGIDPLSQVAYETRASVIKNPDGTKVFEINDVEVPVFWSQVATDILAQKYFRKTGVPQHNADGSPKLDAHGKQVLGPERSVRQVVERLAGCWRHWGETHGYFASGEDAQAFEDELKHMLVHQMTAPNSPQWFNTGLAYKYGITGQAQGHWYADPQTGELKQSDDAYTRGQVHACFILSVKDDLVNEGGIFDLVTREARIFKYGSGVGTNFSTLRGAGERLSGGGRSSGLMSFLKIYDRAAGAIKSGGTTRRAAKMVVLNMDHPEIEAFVDWKMYEEQKVAHLVTGSITLKQRLGEIMDVCKRSGNSDLKTNRELRVAVKRAIDANVPLSYIGRTLQLAQMGVYEAPMPRYDTHFEGEAYNTVSGQNSNNSIRIPNRFFTALDEDADWRLVNRTNGEINKTLKAKELWKKVCYAAWASADPGVQYDDTINEWHTCPEDGRINASNPCVTGDTRVPLADGSWVRIDALVGKRTDIVVNPGLIMTASIRGSFKTGHKSVYRLTTRSGYELKLTADHKVFTPNRGYVPAEQLTQDDLVMLPAAPIAPVKPIDDPTFYQLLGVYLGCGSGGKVQLTMHKEQDMPILQKFAEYAAEQEHLTHKHSQACVRITKTSGKLAITNTALTQRIASMVDLSLKSHQKRLSDAIFGLTLSEQRYVLQGLFTADGTVANYGKKSQYISLDSTSLQLLKDVQLLLLGFGIKSKIHRNRRAGKDIATLPDGKGGLREYAVKETHSLRISRSSRYLFQLIGFMPESHKQRQLEHMNLAVVPYADKPMDAVKALEYIGEEDVYDLTEPFTSSFVANGITVHNCSEYLFLDNTACNLASINLSKFLRQDNTFDIEGYKHATRLWTIVLEISVLMAHFPSKEVAKLSYEFRTLGLGYANLGTVLMRMGIPYDSDRARAIAGALTAIMCGESYATSAELARHLGPFARYDANKQHMLRVIRNHRRAAYDAPEEEYEGLTIKPVGIDPRQCPSDMLEAARDCWDRALALGEQYGYRNAQVTVIAPTGTIGLLMDCDTTGVEPDFALVKFKKLAGGGYLKIVNQSVPAALRTLGYAQEQIQEIVHYAVGHGTLRGCPHINPESLQRLGFTKDRIEAVERQLSTAFELSFAFTTYTLGKEFLESIGMSEEQLANPMLDVLSALGFSKEQIQEANDYVCGTMTIEGAPHLKEEHYPVFDCANKCGRYGTRYLRTEAHIMMMAAVQPFISGAISKTINMPKEASVEDIGSAYIASWKLMLKANALYRDGCKLSQPLNATSSDLDAELLALQSEDADETVTPEIIQQAITIGLRPLPARRHGFAQEATVGGHRVVVKTGEYEDGSLGELQIDMYKEGVTYGCLMNAFAQAVSTGLQYGVPLEEYVDQFTFTKFEPSGVVFGDPRIRQATSVVDYVFRLLGSEYLGRDDLVHIKDAPARRSDKRTHQTVLTGDTISIAKAQGYIGEPCSHCGSMKVKQNGSCAVCIDCGTTTGCS